MSESIEQKRDRWRQDAKAALAYEGPLYRIPKGWPRTVLALDEALTAAEARAKQAEFERNDANDRYNNMLFDLTAMQERVEALAERAERWEEQRASYDGYPAIEPVTARDLRAAIGGER